MAMSSSFGKNSIPRRSRASASKDKREKKGATLQKCSSWMTRNDEKLQVSTIQLLQRSDVASHKFVNFVTILGPARQGKSFLMNCLIGDDVFSTTDTMGVCTKGVQVANVAYQVKNGGCALFVDTEGQGDEDVDSDTMLLTPILLLSKVILYNWKGGLQKNKILDELAILVEVGKCVSSNSFEDDTSKFGHLHIVLRDFHFQGTEDEAFDMIFSEETKPGEKIRERNKIREKLLSSFQSISISIFPAPCEDVNGLDPLTTNDEFKQSVEQLKDMIIDQLNTPRCFGNIVVDSKNANVLVEKFIEELEEGDVVHLKSVVCQIQREIINEAKRCFEESLVEALRKIDTHATDGIDELLTQERDALLEAFKESTAKVDLETVYRDDVFESLEEFADRELDAKRRENHLAIQSKKAEQKEVLAKAIEEFRSTVERELARNSEARSEKMRQDFEIHKQKLIDQFLVRTDKLDSIPERTTEELEKLTSWATKRLNEKIEAKKKEEEHHKKYEQQVRLSRAVESFRSGVESALQRNRETSSQRLRENFQVEKEKLVRAYRDSARDVTPRQAEEELERLISWASRKLNETVQALEETELTREREQKQARDRAKQNQALIQSMLASQASSTFSPQPSMYSPQLDSQASSIFSPQSSMYSPQPSMYSPQLDSQASSAFSHQSSMYSPQPSMYSPQSSMYSPQSPVYSPQSSTSGLKHYKGGQFTPGGGRAPAGGCYMSPPSGSSSRSSSSTTSSGTKFYKGGQFLPGGGRAPKGGCQK